MTERNAVLTQARTWTDAALLWDKPDSEGQIDSTYTRYLRSQTQRDRSRTEDRYCGREQGRWKMMRYYSVGRVPVWVNKSSGNVQWDGYITPWIYLLPLNSTLRNGLNGKFYVHHLHFCGEFYNNSKKLEGLQITTKNTARVFTVWHALAQSLDIWHRLECAPSQSRESYCGP